MVWRTLPSLFGFPCLRALLLGVWGRPPLPSCALGPGFPFLGCRCLFALVAPFLPVGLLFIMIALPPV
eukprot:9121051-Karenia_brevis.AAC.1